MVDYKDRLVDFAYRGLKYILGIEQRGEPIIWEGDSSAEDRRKFVEEMDGVRPKVEKIFYRAGLI